MSTDAAADASRRAWREGLGVALATSAYGISFGALATASGLDIWQTCVLSLVMFTGGSQFAFIGVIGAGGVAAAPAAIASAGLLGIRNVAYGLRMAPIVGVDRLRRLIAPHFTIDESTAVALAHTEPRARRVGFWVTGIGIYIGWNLTTLLGALLGALVAVQTLGVGQQIVLDARVPALVVAAGLLIVRAPFLVVVVAAALVAALLRLWGLAA